MIFPALNRERVADRSLSLLESCANGRIILPRYVVETGNLRCHIIYVYFIISFFFYVNFIPLIDTVLIFDF